MNTAIIWFRQDLRLADNPALSYACKHYNKVICLYINDATRKYPMGSAQLWWLHQSLLSLENELHKHNAQLVLKTGKPADVINALIKKHDASAIVWNRCYEPDRIAHDRKLKQSLSVDTYTFNGSLLNEPWTVLNKSGRFFKVFTPYWKACLRSMNVRDELPIPKIQSVKNIDSEKLSDWSLLPKKPDWSKQFADYWQVSEAAAQKRLHNFIESTLNDYDHARDVPGVEGTSKLSPYLHMGQISPVQIWRQIRKAKGRDKTSVERYLAELGWREFSYNLLYHYPQLPEDNFKPEFNRFKWTTKKKQLQAWQQGQTGYPIVDAGMRELYATGTMHNRVRMIVASFLTKDLLIDWRVGEAWFWDTLLDADLASNSASWQWVAGCGADAAPYFRIFNPTTQSEKFDPEGEYLRRWVPELNALPNKWIHRPSEAPADVLAEANVVLGEAYPKPIVDHSEARKIALERYQALKS